MGGNVGLTETKQTSSAAADTVLGATTDAAVITNADGTISAKLRGIVAILADVWVSASHWLKVAIATELPEGTKNIGDVDIASIAAGVGVGMNNLSACKLQKSFTVAEDVALAIAATDYPMANAMAAGTKYLCVYCASAVKVAMGAATSATNGVWVAAGQPTVFPVVVTGTAADDKAHAQTATAGAIVTFTSMKD